MDWKTLIEDLLETGMSQKQVGAAIGRSQPYIADILKGRYIDVKWSDGEKLRKLHTRKVCRRKGKSA